MQRRLYLVMQLLSVSDLRHYKSATTQSGLSDSGWICAVRVPYLGRTNIYGTPQSPAILKLLRQTSISA